MTDAPGGKTPLWEHCHCTKGTGEYEKKTARHPACVGRAAFGGTGRIPRAGPRAGAEPAHPPHGTHRRGIDAGGAVHHRHRGQLWSRTGTRLNSIQSGYARPALAVGKNRFVLYNRSGNELRVESRTQNLYTKTMENSITLCAMADNGTLAVVTEDPGSAARLRVYSSSMEQLLSWSLTIADGTPLRLAFSPDGRRLAVAAVTVNGGQMVTNFYVVTLAQGDPMLVGSGSGAAQWLSWTGSQSILAVCDSRAVLYNASGGERAAYDFTGQTLRDISVDASGNTALLLASGQLCQAVMLGRDLGVENTTQVQASNRIVRSGAQFYLLTDNGVECLSTDGTSQWTQSLSARPQGLLADRRQLLVFCGNTVQVLTPPAAENNAQSNT